MSRYLHILAIAAILSVLAVGCSDETDESVDPRQDAGADADESASAEIPSVDTIDPDGAEPSDPGRIVVETSDTAGVISEDAPLPAADFLSGDDVADLMSADDLDAQPIAGQDRSEAHSSIRYAPVDDADDFGVGLQIWDLQQLDVTPDERLAELRDQFLSPQDASIANLGDGAFTSRRAGIRNLVFVGESGRHLFVLSCDTTHCRNLPQMGQLATDIAAGDADEQ